ncbi:uncharacterized protein EI90DRAFT_3279887, partial [Cantharellus anzutake]|uniref:uncharacterized protein n=1 Tax=Cantharellus anzutake TaxID=1750568 RepID=UPI0019076F22
MQNSSNGAAGASLAQKQLHPIPSPNGPVSSGQSIPHQPSDWSPRPATSPLSKARLSQHPVSSSANNHALNAPNPLLDPRVPSGVDNSQRPRSDILGVRTSSENTAVSIFSMYVDHDTVPDAPESVSAPHGSRLSSGNHAVRPPSRILDRLASTLRSSVESSKTPSDRPQSQNSTAGLAYLDGISGTELLSFKPLHSPPISDTLPISSTSANFESAVTIAINGPQTPTSDDGDSFFCPPFPSIPSHSTTAKGPMMRPSSRSSRVKSQDAQASISSPDILASQESGSRPRLSSTSARPSSSTSDPRHPSSSSIHGHIDSTNLYAGAPTIAFTHLSPDKGSATASAKSASILSQPPSHRGADEEADAEYVRNVYARFDALGGVPGDGFEEGVERTRARLPSAVGVTYSDEVGVVKGANISEREEQRLRNVDRYGFFTDSKSSHHDSRLTLLPTAPFTRRIK